MSKDWPLWEVFVRGKGGLSHRHVGRAWHAGVEVEHGFLLAAWSRQRAHGHASRWILLDTRVGGDAQ